MRKSCELYMLIVILLSSCSISNYTTRLQSVNNNAYWDKGRQYVYQSLNGIEVVAGFLQKSGGHLVFYFDILNTSGDTFLVSPEQFYCVSFDEDSIPFWPKTFADDPEVNIHRIKQKMDGNEVALKKYFAFSLLSSFLNIASAIVCKTDANYCCETPFFNLDEAEYSYLKAEESLSNQKRIWENDALRRTTLFPNQSISGRVFFEQNKQAHSYHIYVPVGEYVFRFDFKQFLSKE